MRARAFPGRGALLEARGLNAKRPRHRPFAAAEGKGGEEKGLAEPPILGKELAATAAEALRCVSE